MITNPSRRQFLVVSGGLLWASRSQSRAVAVEQQLAAVVAAEPVIDIHQHTTYRAQSNETLMAHQRAMGVTRTILLPPLAVLFSGHRLA